MRIAVALILLRGKRNRRYIQGTPGLGMNKIVLVGYEQGLNREC
jgi:hypothetical protein